MSNGEPKVDKNNLDDHAYVQGQIAAIVGVLVALMTRDTRGGEIAFLPHLAEARQRLRDSFATSNKDLLAGGDDVISSLEQSINRHLDK